MKIPPAASPYQLDLLPLAVATIVATTAVPIELRAPVWWQGDASVCDVVNNFLLYVPLGIALWRHSILKAFGAGLLLSIAIELTQPWSVGRFVSPVDITFNSIGAAFGALAWRHAKGVAALDRFPHYVNGPCLAVAALGILTVLVLWSIPVRSPGLSSWDPHFPMQIGNEATLDRPWSGTILQLEMLPAATTSDDDVRPASAAGGIVESDPLVINDGQPILVSPAASRKFALAAIDTNSFAVAARVVPNNDTQDGPARIVSFSDGPMNGNFDLGQEARRVVFRVCTHLRDQQCQRLRTETDPVLQTGKQSQILASYDGHIARIHIDGALHGRRNLTAAGCLFPAMCDTAVPFVWALLGGLAATITLAVIPWHTARQALVIGLMAGAAVLAITRLFQIGRVPVSTLPWAQLMALFGASAVALAARIDGRSNPRSVAPAGPTQNHG